MTRFSTKPKWETEYDSDVEVLEQESKKYQIIVYNDDINTFDWVIESLMDVCEHTPEQAEQCTILIHYKGKCDVLSGSYEDLKPRCSELLNRNINAEII
ncbi:ATP-dependent Clp protease adaptor ClpS [Faecalibacter rhinopitheci]|uniref:ATP-dependent Clp protease adaptor ClpS n=1 Tax=Faecalibacter rhinopitheci TaxID=2779678 RepID=A0A8J7K4T7_9FLAO|nr:ATP-dependent Clp protease adaptor ClpS [Faecalibacter rhinopitheci]MBF0598054.1 ATP-dependent Clp protease adaptor ClpS [Faecalibacter rhinopitheci]MBQ0147405.1 ATP-dependent Clp protease adaptor ClpS [Candidatus Onthonaster equi]